MAHGQGCRQEASFPTHVLLKLLKHIDLSPWYLDHNHIMWGDTRGATCTKSDVFLVIVYYEHDADI